MLGDILNTPLNDALKYYCSKNFRKFPKQHLRRNLLSVKLYVEILQLYQNEDSTTNTFQGIVEKHPE